MRYFSTSVSIILLSASCWASEVFNDGFEGCTDAGACNTGTAWDTETDTGSDMACDDTDNITPFEGGKVCQDVMNDTTVAFVEDDGALSTESEVWARFYFLIALGGTYVDGNSFQLFRLRNEADSATESLFFLEQDSTGNDRWNVRLNVTLDDASTDTSSLNGFLLAGRWYCGELHWKAATGVGANDGISELYIDGRTTLGLTTLDNDTRNVGEFSFGDIAGLDATPAMTLYLDAVIVRDDSTRPGCAGYQPRGQVVSGIMESIY